MIRWSVWMYEECEQLQPAASCSNPRVSEQILNSTSAQIRLFSAIQGETRRALSRAHVPPTKVFRRFAVNKTVLKPWFAAVMGSPYVYVGFFRRNKFLRCSAYTILEKAICFRHPDYNPDRAQKLISSSRHLSTCNISSKSMHALLSILLTDRQTDKLGQKHLPPSLSEAN